MRSLRLALSIVALLGTVNAGAACYGTGAFQTCNDNAGNNYNVQRYGNTTQVQGSNPSTGSTWNQTTQTYGNITQHQGTASNGAQWNGTSQSYGGTTHYQGIDSGGNPYSKTCTSGRCY